MVTDKPLKKMKEWSVDGSLVDGLFDVNGAPPGRISTYPARHFFNIPRGVVLAPPLDDVRWIPLEVRVVQDVIAHEGYSFWGVFVEVRRGEVR